METLPNPSILKGSTNLIKPNFIHRLFEEKVKENSNEIALIFEDANEIKTHSYAELNNITNKIARGILATITNGKVLPNNDGDYIVAISMQPSDNLIIVLLAIWKSGAAYLPIDPTFPKNRVEHIVSEAKPALVIYEKDFDFTDQVISKTFNELHEESKYYPEDIIKEENYLKHEKDNLATVLYTSGSTGVPKGVRIPHEVILNRLNWQYKTFPYSTSEKIGVFKTVLTFVDSISEIWGPLLHGLSVLIIPKKVTQDPEKLVDTLEQYKIERLLLVPSLLRSLLLYLNIQKNEELLRSLKIWISSGEPLPIPLVQEFFKYFPENEYVLCNFYGSTEVMDITYHVISGLDQLKNQNKVPIGLPIDNTIIYLLDDNLRPVEYGNIGALWVSGLIAAGYVNGREPERFIANPHQTMNSQFEKLYQLGDYAKIENGNIVYEGRTDSQVKIRGHRVDLLEVETAVNSLPVIEKGVVLRYLLGDMDQALLAFVTLRNECRLNKLQIESIIQKKLTSYMWPQIIILEAIPLLVNGKTDRQTLLKSYEITNKNDDTTVHIAIDYTGITDHQMPAAKVLLETIASVLNRNARSVLTINANFYKIGGNSLNSILTISKLNKQGYYISIGDFIESEDLREILNHMSPEKQILPVKTKTTKYSFEMLNDGHRNKVFTMMIDSFYGKGDLEMWLMPDIHIEDYGDILAKIWDVLIYHDLSFVAKTESEKIVGVALNLDARDEPDVKIDRRIDVLYEIQEYIEGPVRDGKLPEGKGKIFHSSFMATNASLSAKENVSVIQYMEEEVIRFARSKKFAGIFSTNTSPLTQQLAIDVYGYQKMSEIQVNKFIASDGSKPFGDAPDSQIAIVVWKPL